MKTATFAAAFLGILALAPTTTSAIPIWGNDTPIVIALDGINPTENTPIVNLSLHLMTRNTSRRRCAKFGPSRSFPVPASKRHIGKVISAKPRC